MDEAVLTESEVYTTTVVCESTRSDNPEDKA
jgi:hypothetical protein